ncbi:unnamed protein product [Caenorhabditis brenneri]
MIECGMRGCSLLFPTENDMKQHVLVAHLLDRLDDDFLNNFLRWFLQHQVSPPPPTPSPNFPPSLTSSVGSNRICGKCGKCQQDPHPTDPSSTAQPVGKGDVNITKDAPQETNKP